MADEIDYNELVERIINDSGMNEMCNDLTEISSKIEENRAISDQQYNTMMTMMTGLNSRLDSHMEAQATQPAKTSNELKKWLMEYMDNYMNSTNTEIKKQKEVTKKHNLEIFGNGKKGLRTEIESLKTKATITLWLVGTLITGGGLSGATYVVWRLIFGG